MTGSVIWHWVLRIWVIEAWVVAILWLWRSIGAAYGLPKVTDLLGEEFEDAPATGPSLTVVVPALNEEATVGECLERLLAQEYDPLRIVAVNDRSTDGTGTVMDALAAKYPERLRVVHIVELPDGWLGKTHAMATAAALEPKSEYLLFTDADVLFRKDALRRTMKFVVESDADHMVTLPTMILKRWDEAALIGFFEVCSLWAARPWKVADPEAKRDAVGVGAFNLLRRSAYEQVGGYEALRMEIIEDLGIARRVRRAGLRQRVAFGRDLVSVHWAAGAMGVVDVLTKNMFSAFGFRMFVLLGACGWLVGFCVLPAAGIAASYWLLGLLLPGLLTIAAMTTVYLAMGKYSGISAWNVLLTPFAAVLLMYTLLRSMVTTLRQGGVIWRGTFYPLKELRRHLGPLW